MESEESQKQASPSFHEPLGNLAKARRDSHIPTAPTTKAVAKVENQKAGFPLSHRHEFPFYETRKGNSGGLSPAR
jgi:hypothetical protein